MPLNYPIVLNDKQERVWKERVTSNYKVHNEYRVMAHNNVMEGTLRGAGKGIG
jgi:hypothetical protein